MQGGDYLSPVTDRCRHAFDGTQNARHRSQIPPARRFREWALDTAEKKKKKKKKNTGPGNVQRPLETSVPGVFAIGDVRFGSVKRVAAAVGDGAQVVAALHAFLATRDKS